MNGSRRIRPLFDGSRVAGSVLLCALAVAGCSGPSSPAVVPPPASAPPTPTARTTPDPVEAEPFDANDQVTKLRELRDKGLISEDEFQARKARLLKAAPR